MRSKRNRVGKAFGVALRDARQHKGLTQEELAAVADYGPVIISLFENGHRQPTISAIIAFEAALGLEPGHLVQATCLALARARQRRR